MIRYTPALFFAGVISDLWNSCTFATKQPTFHQWVHNPHLRTHLGLPQFIAKKSPPPLEGEKSSLLVPWSNRPPGIVVACGDLCWSKKQKKTDNGTHPTPRWNTVRVETSWGTPRKCRRKKRRASPPPKWKEEKHRFQASNGLDSYFSEVYVNINRNWTIKITPPKN